jgi:DNA modification methylase
MKGRPKRPPKSRNARGGCVLLKADAFDLPLGAGSMKLVIATPPHLGVRRLGRAGFYTSDWYEYRDLLAAIQRQCLRVLAPGGHLVFYLREGKSRIWKVFDVFQKRRQQGRWRLQLMRSHAFRVRYVRVPGFWWWALPVALYRRLIARYSQPADAIAHIFSGSGNGGIAAAQLGRNAFLVDLQYHRLRRRRLTAVLGSKGIS